MTIEDAWPPLRTELLGTAEMARADRLTIAGGVLETELIAAAGKAVADIVRLKFTPRPVIILCGPGNNGADGLIAALTLLRFEWPVRIAVFDRAAAYKEPARRCLEQWPIELPVEQILPDLKLDQNLLVIDAMFGSGLNRSLPSLVISLIRKINSMKLPVVAIDVPSGIAGDSGALCGAALQAAVTVTFCRAKPAHYLLPGREYCGEVVVRPIGLTDIIVRQAIDPTQQTALNHPRLWRHLLPLPAPDNHKYKNGHVLVRSGQMTGAARLAAASARALGAGLVSIAATGNMINIFRADAAGVMVRDIDKPDDFSQAISEKRYSMLLLGPGNGVDAATRSAVETALRSGKPTLLDADALNWSDDHQERISRAIATFDDIRRWISGPTIMTPHEGEFFRMFPTLRGSKLERTRAAAALLGAVIVLKGADTVIAHPDGRAIINNNAPPSLAIAGAGDVLSGAIAGLIAQGMPIFHAAAAAVWLHGAAAHLAQGQLLAEDLPKFIGKMAKFVARGRDFWDKKISHLS